MSVDQNDLPRPFGPFTLLRLIAQGGMGAVFLALRPVDEEESKMRQLPESVREGQEEVCVVKTVRSDLKADREAIGRFLDEARVVQKLAHPRIARTLDAGVIEKTYFLSLEFISGRNLRDVQTRAQKLGKALPEPLIVHVIADMLEGLEHAHSLNDVDTGRPLNIVHRDVSPHNVMLGFDGNTKLIDFGLAAHELKRELTRPGVMVGKLRYNAPEQVRDKALDGRSDVYSAAVVLYEFIANERFYEGLPEEQVWRVAMKGDHRPRSWRDIDIEWRHLLDVALQNDPEKRYRSAGEFREALLDVADSRGVDLKNMRREASRFVRDAFATEQASEREMILQATGIAEARTRLFRTPSELQSALGDLGAKQPQPEVKTEIFDPSTMRGKGADQLRELQNMMSRFADPNAETQLPGEPIDSRSGVDDSAEALNNDTFHVDAPGSLSSAASDASDAPLAGSRKQKAVPTIEAQVDDLDDEQGLARTVAGRRSRSIDELSSPPPPPPRPEPNPTTGSLSRRSNSRSRPDPLPPLAPRKQPPAPGSPVAALLIGLVVVAAFGALAIVIVPRMLRPSNTPLVVDPIDPAGTVDAGAGIRPTNGVGEAVDGAVDAGAVDAGAVVVVAAGDAGVVVAVDVDAGTVEVAEAPDAGVEPRQKVVRKKPPQAPPPKKVLKSFKEQVDYLKQYCMSRVACARSLVGSANAIMSLTPDELRDLKDEAPSCIERCQR